MAQKRRRYETSGEDILVEDIIIKMSDCEGTEVTKFECGF